MRRNGQDREDERGEGECSRGEKDGHVESKNESEM